jgi:hypothetical protein
MGGELMARGKKLEDLTILRMALVGYQAEKDKIDARIAEIQAQLGGKAVPLPSAVAEKKAGTKRVLSPAARKRIARAQKKRWAEHRKRLAAGA